MTAGAMAGWLTVYVGRRSLDSASSSRRWPARRSACCTALLTVPLGLSQHVTGIGITLLASSLAYFIYRLRVPERHVAAEHRAVPSRWRSRGSRTSRRRPASCSARRRSPISPSSLFAVAAFVLYRTPLGLAVRTVGRKPGGGRGAGHRRHRAAHRRRRRRQRPDGARRRVPHHVGVQRLLLRDGQRPRLDLHRAGGVRLLAARARRCWARCCSVAFDAFQLRLQQLAGGAVPYQVFLMLPYILSIVALIVMSRRAAYPRR